MITAEGLGSRLHELEPIGLSEQGTNRLAWTTEDAASAQWFESQAAEIGLVAARDPAGNLWACPKQEGPWWGLGSHLDTVHDGGRFDGALGVAAAFEIARLTKKPVAVISFADEEGARFNTPTFGSRALVGRLDLTDVLARRDDDGVLLGDAMRSAGVDPEGLGRTGQWLGLLRGFLEVHIDQSTDVATAGAPVGVVRELACRLRLEVDLRGEANHAGTTRRTKRRDALAAAARLIVAGDDLAAANLDFVMTPARILVSPNALTTVPSHVHLWLDARAPAPDHVDLWRLNLLDVADKLERSTGVDIEITVASRSARVSFDETVRGQLRAAGEALFGAAPELTCFAGHDAGVISECVPAGMVLVRNPLGISHTPQENVSLHDAAAAATIVLRALENLA